MAGRLHVEVMRLSGDVGERIAGGDESMDASLDKETQENRLVCMVSPRLVQREYVISACFLGGCTVFKDGSIPADSICNSPLNGDGPDMPPCER